MKVYIPQKQTSLCCFLVFFSCPATREILQIPVEKESLPLDAVLLIVFEKSRKSVKETPLPKKAR